MSKEVIKSMYKNGFPQRDIANILNVDQSTVSRTVNNKKLTKKEEADFYENNAYGAFTTKSNEYVLFNRRYKPLNDKERFVTDITVRQWFYTDATPWNERIINSKKHIIVYEIYTYCSECKNKMDHSNEKYPDVCSKCLHGIV